MTARVRTRAFQTLAIVIAGAALVGIIIALAASPGTRRATAERDEPANLLLITIDTLRPDHLGCFGNPGARTPNLDALAESGVLFETTIASAPSTAPSHATMMTALSQRAHGVLANGQKLSEGIVTLAERLHAAGYATGAVVSAGVLAPRTGLDRGFDAYIRAYERPGRKNEVSIAESTFTRALPWIRQHANGRYFLWVHLYDPHQPYEAPGVLGEFADPSYEGRMKKWDEMLLLSWNRLGTIPARDARHINARYDAEVSYVDAQVGRFLSALDDAGVLGRTLVCVTSDHGETLGEHAGYFGHVHQLYDTTLRVPLIFSRPGAPDLVPAGRIVSRSARLLDLAPTCLDLLRLPPMERVEGRSLLPFDGGVAHATDIVRAESRADSATLASETAARAALAARDQIVCETGPSDREGPEVQTIPRIVGARTPKAKLLRWLDRDSMEVFDLAADPGETRNLAGSGTPLEADLAGLLSLWEQAMGGAPVLEALDDETRERLRSLGYIE